MHQAKVPVPAPFFTLDRLKRPRIKAERQVTWLILPTFIVLSSLFLVDSFSGFYKALVTFQ